jgi:hypothetical protein
VKPWAKLAKDSNIYCRRKKNRPAENRRADSNLVRIRRVLRRVFDAPLTGQPAYLEPLNTLEPLERLERSERLEHALR